MVVKLVALRFSLFEPGLEVKTFGDEALTSLRRDYPKLVFPSDATCFLCAMTAVMMGSGGSR